jgi:N-acetyl-1-D-myo-inositol-2-amino-2-deoxy-alpha-D-glucopyranoside deacetylase
VRKRRGSAPPPCFGQDHGGNGQLDSVDPTEVIAAIADHLRRLGPQVVVTMPPGGCDGHPDHAVLSQLATAAVVRAAETGREPVHGSVQVVSKLYYLVMTRATLDGIRTALAPTIFTIDGITRDPVPWPDWAVTAELDTTPFWKTVWSAVQCHRTQIEGRERLARLDNEGHRALWGVQRFYRAFSLVSRGRERETDLFAGLR